MLVHERILDLMVEFEAMRGKEPTYVKMGTIEYLELCYRMLHNLEIANAEYQIYGLNIIVEPNRDHITIGRELD